MVDNANSQDVLDYGENVGYDDAAMGWATLQYSLDEVASAGDVLVDKKCSADDYDRALDVVNNWRSCHAFALNTLQMNLRRKASAMDVNATIAQRIKRLPAIIHKLDRLRWLRLSKIQDIGGCRGILSNVRQVNKLRDEFVNGSGMQHILITQDDYITNPKKTGYRGIHLVYEYRSKRNSLHNGRKIEIQLRSRLQHAWATAVETVGLFSQQYLKSNRGDTRWLRFFSLMGSAMAQREKVSPVPGTPTDTTELISELTTLASELEVRTKLAAWTSALQWVRPQQEGSHFLLSLDTRAERLTVTTYGKSQLEQANADYLKLEKDNTGKPGRDAVLVTLESVKSLRTAYPNYFADTRLFMEAVDAATKNLLTKGNPRQLSLPI